MAFAATHALFYSLDIKIFTLLKRVRTPVALNGTAHPAAQCCVPALHSRSLTRRQRIKSVECSAGELLCPQPDTRFLVEYVRRDYAMLTRTARVNRHLKTKVQPVCEFFYMLIIMRNEGTSYRLGVTYIWKLGVSVQVL